MKATSQDATDNRFEAEAAAMSWLLGGRTQDELARLADRLRMAIKAEVGNKDLQPELLALMGPKAEALPDCIVTLYLREVPSFTLAELRRHLDHFAEPIEVEQWLRFMGIARLSEQEPVPRPRFFPRRMLAADMANNPVKTAATSATTYNRCLQLLAQLGLILEAPANNLGALDTQVTRSLLELVEREIAATPLTTISRHPRDIRPVGSDYVHRLFGAMAMVVMLGAPDSLQAGGFEACVMTQDAMACPVKSDDGWASARPGTEDWQTAGTWRATSDWAILSATSDAQESTGCLDPFVDLGCLAAKPMGQDSSFSDDVVASQLKLAALDDVIQGSSRLLGPQPIPQPVEPLQRSFSVPFVGIMMP